MIYFIKRPLTTSTFQITTDMQQEPNIRKEGMLRTHCCVTEWNQSSGGLITLQYSDSL